MNKTGWLLFVALIALWLLVWAWMPCDNFVWSVVPDGIMPRRCG